MSDRRRRRLTLLGGLWLVAYAVAIVAIILTLLRARQAVLAPERQARAQQDWQRWRADVEKQNRTGPVRRTPPPSTEPPAIVLLRDHFARVIVASVGLGSMLFVALSLAIRAALSGGKQLLPPSQ